MYQFFVEPSQINVSTKRVVIEGSDVNHIKNVLRMHSGEEIAVSNGTDGKEYRCQIRNLGDTIECELLFIKEDAVELPAKIYLFQGLPKGDKMETIIQKAVELGVYCVVPVSMKRCVMKLDEKKAKNKITRYNAIAEAAAKQSKRAVIPQVENVCNVKEAINIARGLDVVFVPYEMAEDMTKTREIMETIKPGQSIGFFVGPEGGIAPEEIQLFEAEQFEEITLGKRILRTETAGMTVLSWLVYLLEGKE
ncbi:MAG: 16S rRNA (uracil(1498)-N(3))-methyltransferase [Lachnospiraceae bacterium]|nr:16S rRNA (uracil(1498)-N(3))-methyltransferase [Candidatus Colinaster equi]